MKKGAGAAGGGHLGGGYLGGGHLGGVGARRSEYKVGQKKVSRPCTCFIIEILRSRGKSKQIG